MFIRCTIFALSLAIALNAVADELQNSVGMSLRYVESGRYERGDRETNIGFGKDHAEFNTAGDESPQHAVVLTKPFYLATTEVTGAQFRQFVEETGYKTSAEANPTGAVGWDPHFKPKDRERYVATFRDSDEFDWRRPGFEQADDHPVVCVSFADAKAFCEWLSKKEGVAYRLPTEAEWEYAARAGTETYFSFGDKYRGVIQRFANIGNVELEQAFPDRVRRQWLVDVERDPPDKHICTAPVGSYEANPWGLRDMHGNVWEWCEDRYLDTAYAGFDREGYQQLRKRAIDPRNDTPWGDAGDWRVIRGGSWFNAPIQCRSGVRGYFEAGDAACYIGFRVARDASAEQIAAAKQRFERSEAARAELVRLADRVQERRDGRLTIELSQQRTRLGDEFFAALRALDEAVDLHIDGRGELTSSQLAALVAAPHLRGLLLSNVGPNIADADCAPLAQHAQLELLLLSHAPKLTDGVCEHLRKLARLELLHLDGPGITDAGLQSLPAMTTLSELRLAGTASRGLALARFRGSPLERFSCDHLSDDGARQLAAFSTVREAWLDGSPLSGVGLAEIVRLPRLSQLGLSRCALLNDEDFAALGDAYELSSLQIDNTAAGEKAAAALARLNNLRQLQIGGPQLTDASVRELCGIVSLRNFTISSQSEQLTDAALVDLWRLVNLDSFGIGAPKVTGSGLANLHELPNLVWLDLPGAGITDIACAHAAKSASLRQLNLGNWQSGGPAITDASLRSLAEAAGLQQVSLHRKGTAITEEGTAALHNRRPNLRINLH